MKKGKILVVGDEADTRTFLCTLLETCGYRSIMATDGMEGLRKARETKPGLIILDVMMLREGGARVYRELKDDRDLKDIPVIMISDVARRVFYHSQNKFASAMGWSLPEPEAFLQKPLEAEDLLRWTESLITERK